jgi:DNA-binding FrmR family transcriptional regulator
MDTEAECSCMRTKERSEEELRDLVHRLNRVEGQIRGIKGMLEKDAYCVDILNQVAAASSALNSFTRVLLENHMRSCVAEDIREGRDEKLEEVLKTLQKLMK